MLALGKEARLGALGDALEVGEVLDKHGDRRDEDDEKGDEGGLFAEEVEREEEDGGEGGGDAVVGDVHEQHHDHGEEEEKFEIDSDDHAAEGGESFAAFEVHVGGEDMPQDTGGAGDEVGIKGGGEEGAGNGDGKEGFEGVEQSYGDTGVGAEDIADIGGAGVLGAELADVAFFVDAEEIGVVEGAEQVADDGGNDVIHECLLVLLDLGNGNIFLCENAKAVSFTFVSKRL